MNAQKGQLITKEKLAALKAELEALPPRSQQTKREVVDELREELAAAVDRGYTYVQLADTLKARGVVIAAGTLQRYMRSSGVIRRKGRSDGARKRSPQRATATR